MLKGKSGMLLPVVDKIYAAAAQEVSLDDAFKSIAQLMGDFVAAMFVHDPMVGDSEMVSDAAYGIDRTWLDFYNRRFGTDNPWIQRGLPDLMAGRIVNTDELMPWSEVQKTDYYREFLRPLGVRYSLGAVISGRAQRFGSLITARSEKAGPYTHRLIGQLDAIRPHLARALHILEFFDGATLSLSLFRTSMDRLPFSILLVDSSRKIVYANASAQRRLDQSDGIAEVRGRLVAVGRDRDAFERAWVTMTLAEISSEGRFSMRSTDDVAPLRIEATRIKVPGVSSGGLMWMLRLSDQVIERCHLMADWRARFAFTPAECKVGLSLLECGNAVSVATQLRIAENTVRVHLKSMFAKTGTHSQTSLVLRLAVTAQVVN